MNDGQDEDGCLVEMLSNRYVLDFTDARSSPISLVVIRHYSSA